MPHKYDNFGRPLEGTIWSAPKVEPGKDKPMLVGLHKRFAISFVVRDAERISDQEVREGKQPPIVGEFTTLERAKLWCQFEEARSDLKQGQTE